MRRDFLPVVGDEKTVGQVHDFLAVERLLLEWQRDPTANHIVDAFASSRPDVTEVTDLNGRRAPCQDLEAVVHREAHQIDCDIDLKLAHEIGDLLAALVLGVDEALERALKTPAHRCISRGPKRYSCHFEPGSVMALEQPRGPRRRRVLVEISGQIGNAGPIVVVDLAAPRRNGC